MQVSSMQSCAKSIFIRSRDSVFAERIPRRDDASGEEVRSNVDVRRRVLELLRVSAKHALWTSEEVVEFEFDVAVDDVVDEREVVV